MRAYVPGLDGLFSHGKTCHCQSCITRNANATMYPATRGPWNMEADSQMRQAQIKDPARYGNSAREDDLELFHLDEIVGHEGWDYQNPYAFATLGVLDYPSAFGTQLDPRAYGVGDSGQAAHDVAINIRATGNVIVKG